MKIKVNGDEIEYEQDDILEAVEILREDGAIRAMGTLRQQNEEIMTWVNEQKAKQNADGANPGNGGGNPSGDQPPESGPESSNDDPTNSGIPAPPPKLTDEEKQENKPKRKRSRWWGDALGDDYYGDSKDD
jgi:hypothetical protein